MVLVHTQALSGGDEQAHFTCHFRTTKQMFPSGAVRSLISSAPGKASGCWLSPPMAELHGAESELTATRALSLTGCSFPACETGCQRPPLRVGRAGGALWLLRLATLWLSPVAYLVCLPAPASRLRPAWEDYLQGIRAGLGHTSDCWFRWLIRSCHLQRAGATFS